MKKLITRPKAIIALMFFLCSYGFVNAQWTGSSTSGPSLRNGNTGVGLFDPSGPQALMHLRIGSLNSEQQLFRLQAPSSSSFFSHIWDTSIEPSGAYKLSYAPSFSSSFSNWFFLSNTGRLGLATSSPSHRLHVNGDGRFNTNLYVDGKMGVGTSSPSQLLTVSSPSDPIIRLERSSGQNHDWEIYSKSGGGLYFRGGGNGSGNSGTPGWGNKMAITSSGRVGIGTGGLPPLVNNAEGKPYNLYVTGGILTEEVKVETGWADYVFEADYDLLSLEAVESHIKTHGHLHDTPSAATIESEGLELKSMTVNQQVKIEELFLHMIEMKKEIENLKAENELLKANKASNK